MDQVLAVIQRYGNVVIFGIVFADQLGVPIPTIPVLLALGALAGTGTISPIPSLLIAVLASVCADSVWFQLGRWKGSRVLGWMCRISLEPDTCVNKTRDLFVRHGVKSLLVAKFLPGFDTVAPPLAGLMGVRVPAFLAWSAAGAALWLGVFGGLGYVFSESLDTLAAAANQVAGTLLLLTVCLTAAYVARKYYVRQRVLRSIRMAHIRPEELHDLFLHGQRPVVVDARSRSALEALPYAIEGALHVTLEDVDDRHLKIPRDREIVVYCSCPNDVSSARVALKLKRLGFARVRPLTGGIEAWTARDFPIVPMSAQARTDGSAASCTDS